MRKHLGEIADPAPLLEDAVINIFRFAFRSLGRNHFYARQGKLLSVMEAIYPMKARRASSEPGPALCVG
jgi:hypothetical protein